MNIEKALVVDDSKVAHVTLRRLLTQRGIEVDWVGSGEDSISYLKKQKPDLVFMDVMMPGMDGFETTHTVTSDTSINSPPIVMCSANATDEDKHNAKKNGAVDFLSKPYTPDELDHILDRIRSLSETPSAPKQPVDTKLTAPPLNEETSSVEGSDAQAPGVAAPEPARPVEQQPAAATSSLDIAHIAERTAWSTADEIARSIAGDVAEAKAREIVNDGIRQAERIAQSTAEDAAAKTSRSVAEETARMVSEQVSRKVADTLTKRMLSSIQENGIPNQDSLKAGIISELEMQIAQQVQEKLTKSMAGEAFRNQLMRAVKESSMPMIKSTARDIAAQVATVKIQEEVERIIVTHKLAGTRGLANLSLGAGVLALLVAAIVAADAIGVFKLSGIFG